MNLSPSFAPSFADARPIAQHCAELTERGPRPEERAEIISAWCRDLGYDLGQELGQLFSAGKLKVMVAEPEETTGKEIFDKIGAVAVNSLLRCGQDGQVMLLSLDLGTAIALTDSSFGGDGAIPENVPAQLPRSAGLLVEQCAGLIAQVIAMSNGSSDQAGGDVLVRSESVTRLKPFAPDAKVMQLSVTLSMETSSEWKLLLAVPSEELELLLPGSPVTRSSRQGEDSVSDGHSGPFAQMPLPLEAVLGEVSMTLRNLETLQPGDELPLPAPRDLPLRAGDKTVAYGVLGTMENQLALKLTRLSGQGQHNSNQAAFARAFAAPATPASSAANPQSAQPDPSAERRRIEGLTA